MVTAGRAWGCAPRKPSTCFRLVIQGARPAPHGTPFANSEVEMTTALELLYEYRHLMGKCRSGAGLDMDEIQAVDAIEALFADDAKSDRAQPGGLTTVVRGAKLCDEVKLESILLDRLVVAGCPCVDSSSAIEIIIEDAELLLSYRFRGQVAWTRDDGKGRLSVGIELVGVPVLVRRGPRSSRQLASMPASARRRIRVARAAA